MKGEFMVSLNEVLDSDSISNEKAQQNDLKDNSVITTSIMNYACLVMCCGSGGPVGVCGCATPAACNGLI